LTSRKRKKSRRKVARPENLTREWKIANLAWLVDFGFAPVIAETDLKETYNRLRTFLSRSAPAGHLGLPGADLEELRWLQAVARDYIEKTARRESWGLSLQDLVGLDSNFRFSYRLPMLPIYELGNLRVIWLFTLGELLGGREGKRIVRCAEPECAVILVKRKKGRFCREHGSLKERARRHRRTLKASLPLAQRRERRSSAHQKHVKRTKGKTAAARVRKRPIRGWELQRDAIEASNSNGRESQ
jgi:hypothetical protein